MPYPPNIIEVFSQASQYESFPVDAVILREGEPGSVMYVIKEGEVALQVNGHRLATLGPGGILGEMAIIDRGKRSATAIALTDCKLVAMERELFLFIMYQAPSFALDVMRVLTTRLRHMDHLAIGLEDAA
jgi:CRP-like cAMP-binding protein